MTGMGGFTLPPIIRRADALLDNIRAFRKTDLPYPAEILADETEAVIGGLKEHAKSEYVRGVKVGRDAAWQDIRRKIEGVSEPQLDNPND